MYQLDQHGFLENYSGWDQSFALAQLERLDVKLVLSEKHWQCLQVLREFYGNFRRHPSMRVFIKLLKQQSLVESTMNLHELFGPKDLLRTMSLLAGLPKPPHCI